MKGEACEEIRNDSYLSCLLGPERQARTEERNGHCFRRALRPSQDTGDTVGPIYGTHVAFTGRELPLLTDTKTQMGVGRRMSGCGGHSSGPHPQVSIP